MIKNIFIPVLSVFFSCTIISNSPAVIRSLPTEEDTVFDGPYILLENNNYVINYVIENNGVKSVRTNEFAEKDKGGYTFQVTTDEPGKTFPVVLKKNLKEEKTEFSKVNKQFVLSDMEGNFRSFRKLLQANQIIDSNYNWTFGDGHLILAGDFVDRGNQQTELLWLIYSLEDKAKAAGGHVHFILGNHEIMNLSGDFRYLNPKYKETESILNKSIVDLYGEKSEMGQWLRTKNVVEEIGSILYLHAGISSAVNTIDVSINKLNKLVRPFYSDNKYEYDDNRTEILMGDLGPFWYRGYYMGSTRAVQSQIDSTLSIYKVKKIVTGHSVVADTISVHFNGKVFNTDVHHAGGHSEAMLIEGDKFYRVNSFGEKFLLDQ